MSNKIYIVITALLFLGFVIVFDTFPRTTYSRLERRDLASFPVFSWEALKDGSFTRGVSSWFSDSEPYRDELMGFSMNIKDMLALKTGGTTVKFHAAENMNKQTKKVESADPESEANREVGEYENHLTTDQKAKILHAGIVVIGEGDNVRALMAFGGGTKGGVGYVEGVNRYKDEFPDVNVYSMVIPLSSEYYCPDEAKSICHPQRPTINSIYSRLDPAVIAVDVYTTLGEHAAEDIYLRTDHHWAPLGAFYAARKFAKVAKVPFKALDAYERRVVHNFVGTMYAYSKDAAIKNAPEDFVYYVPKDVEYSTVYTDYTVDEDWNVIGEGKPHKGSFFAKFRDGSSKAYMTFMGGDAKITQVKTSTKNGRRLLILKDSYGNALPGYLFYSFEEIHVIDFRCFIHNMRDYVREHEITDILFATNIFNAYAPHVARSFVRFLTQENGKLPPKKRHDEGKAVSGHETLPVDAPDIPEPEELLAAPVSTEGEDGGEQEMPEQLP